MLEDEIKEDTKVKEGQAVQNDLLRLEERRMRDLLSAKADAVFSLGKTNLSFIKILLVVVFTFRWD